MSGVSLDHSSTFSAEAGPLGLDWELAGRAGPTGRLALDTRCAPLQAGPTSVSPCTSGVYVSAGTLDSSLMHARQMLKPLSHLPAQILNFRHSFF